MPLADLFKKRELRFLSTTGCLLLDDFYLLSPSLASLSTPVRVCLPIYVLPSRGVKVMASKTKIYIVMELVTGGELFDKIVSVLSSSVTLVRITALSSSPSM